MSVEEIKKLSIPERLLLLEKVWDSLVDAQDALPLTDVQRNEIDRRLKDLKQNPHSVESLDQVRAYVRDPKRPK